MASDVVWLLGELLILLMMSSNGEEAVSLYISSPTRSPPDRFYK
jgi:hypothetical protein